MLNLDPGKLLIVAVVAIIILGPDKLPNLAKQVGGTWQSFNKFRTRMEAEVRSNLPDLPATSRLATLVTSPTALLDHLSSMTPIPAEAEEQADLARIWTSLEDAESTGSLASEASDIRDKRPQGNLENSQPTTLVVTVDANLN